MDEKAFFLGMNVADHLAAATHNVLASNEGTSPIIDSKFERCLYYDGLTETSIAELKQLADSEGMALLQRLNERALELKRLDSQNPTPESQRINIGLYVYDEAVCSETAFTKKEPQP